MLIVSAVASALGMSSQVNRTPQQARNLCRLQSAGAKMLLLIHSAKQATVFET